MVGQSEHALVAADPYGGRGVGVGGGLGEAALGLLQQGRPAGMFGQGLQRGAQVVQVHGAIGLPCGRGRDGVLAGPHRLFQKAGPRAVIVDVPGLDEQGAVQFGQVRGVLGVPRGRGVGCPLAKVDRVLQCSMVRSNSLCSVAPRLDR